MYDAEQCGARCKECPLYGRTPIAPVGPADSTFLIIDDHPSIREAEQGRLLAGSAGDFLDSALTRAGTARNKVRLTSVVLCCPPDGDLDAYEKQIKADNKKRASRAKKNATEAGKAQRKEEKTHARWLREVAKIQADNDKAVEKHAREVEKYNKRHERERTRIEKVGGDYVPTEAPPALPVPKPLPPAPTPAAPVVQLMPDVVMVNTPTACCAPRLAREIESAQTLLMLGKRPMESASGREIAILDEQGFPMILPNGKNGVGLPHPATLLHGMEKYRGPFVLWVARAVRQWRDGLKLVNDPSPFYTGWRVERVLREAIRLAEVRKAQGLGPLNVAIDVETDGLDVAFSALRCVGVAFGDVTAVVAITSIAGDPIAHQPAVERLRELLRHPHICKIFHNGMFDFPVLEARVGPIDGPVGDTLLMHHVIESEVPHSLSFVASLLLDAPSWKSLGDGTHGLSVQDDRQLWLYNSVDVSRTIQMVPALMKMLEDDGVLEVYEQTAKLLPILARMGGRGFLVDEAKRNQIRDKLNTEHTRCVAEMHSIIEVLDPTLGGSFQYSKPSHRDCAWELLAIAPHLDKTEKAGTYKSTADDLMRALPNVHASARDFIGKKFGPGSLGAGYLGAQSTQKAVSTFCEVKPSPDGRLRSSWKIHGTPTGRLSSAGPNLQNIPEWLRAMYVAPEGYVYVAADYSALELWIVAIYSQALNLLKALESADVHRVNTEALFGLKFGDKLAEAASTGCPVHGTIPPSTFDLIDAGKKFDCQWDEVAVGCPDCVAASQAAFHLTVDKLAKLRGQAKRFVYAGNYGGSEQTIWMKLLVEFPSLRLEDVMFLGQQWKKVNPQISQRAKMNENLYYQRRLKHGVGWLESPVLGRRRYWTGKEFGPTDAANYPIQSAAADIVNGALIAIDPDATRMGARLVAQVHDSLVYEVPEDKADTIKQLLIDRMPGNYTFRGIDGTWSFPVEAKIGKHWSEV